MPEQLHWTISAAPDADEPATRLPSRRPIHKASRKANLIIAVVVISTLAGVAGFGVWNDFRVHLAVKQVVLAEERAAGAGDVDALLGLTDPSDSTLRRMQISLSVNNQPAPLPSQVLRPLPNTTDAISLTATAPGEARADVTRYFFAPDGSRLAFTLPQFYRFEQGSWKRIAPPVGWNVVLTRGGNHADIAYLAADAGFVEKDLGPYLDDILQRACAAWACSQDSKIRLQFASSSSLLIVHDQSPLPHDEPLLFAFVWSQYWTNQGSTLLLPAPHFAGYPANTASANWLRHAIAVQALAELATRLTMADRVTPSRNAFLMALVTRMAANLGLEPAQSVTSPAPVARLVSDTADLSRNVNLMWDLSLRDSQGSPLLVLRDAYGNLVADDPAGRDRVLRSALAMTNWLLRDQPTGTENKLFRALALAPDQSSWLAQGLGISQDEAWARLQFAVWQLNGLANRPELALACSYGAALASPGQAPTYFLVTDGWTGLTPSYSPDGKWLVVEHPGGPLAVDLHSGSFIDLAGLATLSPNNSVLFRGWITNSVLAYIVRTDGTPALSTVHFLDVANPKRSFQPVPGIQEYELSPDRRLVAVITAPDPQLPDHLKLAVMPAWGGPATWIDDALLPDWPGSFAAWSPDSRSIAYDHFDQTAGSFTLRVADAATGSSREILSNRDLNVRADIVGLLAWSPTGHQIAFAFQNHWPQSMSTAWLGMVNTDGSNRTLLRVQTAFYTQLNFSADGQYLATTFDDSIFNSGYDSHMLIYDAPGGGQTNALRTTWAYAWSPTGHQLAVINSGGADVITHLGSLPRPKPIGEYCSSVAWNPAQ